jgi:hypothetical protein
MGFQVNIATVDVSITDGARAKLASRPGTVQMLVRASLVLLCLWSSLAMAYALDISGVALGSDLAGAKSILGRANPKLTFNFVRSKDGSQIGIVAREVDVGISAVDGHPGEFLRDEFIVLAGKAGTIWYVERNVKTSADRLFSYPLLVGELRRQYGGPSSQSAPAGRPEVAINNVMWETDRSGKPYVGSMDSGPCGLPVFDSRDFLDRVLAIPVTTKDSCGLLVVAKVPRATPDGKLTVIPKPLGVRVDGKIASYSLFILDGSALRKR